MFYPYYRVDTTGQIVIGDFGLARDIYQKEYYHPENLDRPVPVKWMAPECLESGLYSTKSDVVSITHKFDSMILLGRTFSMGLTQHEASPYVNIINTEFYRIGILISDSEFLYMFYPYTFTGNIK